MTRRCQHGVTLVELVMAVVVISIAVTGVLLAYVQTVRTSADPMIDAQSLAIAEAYMEEILAKPVAGGGGTTRTTYSAIGDYNGLTEAPTDQLGTPLGLNGYCVNVATGNETVNAVSLTFVQVTVGNATCGGGATRSVELRSHKVDF